MATAGASVDSAAEDGDKFCRSVEFLGLNAMMRDSAVIRLRKVVQMGDVSFVGENRKGVGRPTYSDLPIQVAERSVSRVEFMKELKDGAAPGVTSVLGELEKLLNTSYCTRDDRYTYNSILARGTAKFQFYILQQLKADICSMNALKLESARLIIDKELFFEVHRDDRGVRLENLSGAFVILNDGKSRCKTPVKNVSFSMVEKTGMLVSIECHNPFSSYSSSSMIRLTLTTASDAGSVTLASDRSRKTDSMRKFRKSYSDLDGISKTGAWSIRKYDGLKSFFARLFGKTNR